MTQNLSLFSEVSDQAFSPQLTQREPSAGPFVKWAGGKTKLIPDLHRLLPAAWNNYFEPFVGGGALFFKLQPRRAFLSDINEELINTYQVVQNDVEKLIRDLQQHEHSAEYFYELRDADRRKYFARWSAVRRASRLLYLNKTCFNGLYRVNSHGYFNVPFGQYKNPKICDPEALRACSRALAGVSLSVGSFEDVSYRATAGDFVYFDPPYAPLSATSTFTSYTRSGFSDEVQTKLRDVCHELQRKGIQFMLSNSYTPLVLELCKDFQVHTVMAARAINSQGGGRGKVREVVVTNY